MENNEVTMLTLIVMSMIDSDNNINCNNIITIDMIIIKLKILPQIMIREESDHVRKREAERA